MGAAGDGDAAFKVPTESARLAARAKCSSCRSTLMSPLVLGQVVEWWMTVLWLR